MREGKINSLLKVCFFIYLLVTVFFNNAWNLCFSNNRDFGSCFNFLFLFKNIIQQMSRGVLSSSLEYFLTYVLGEKEQKVAKLMSIFFQTDEKKGGSGGIAKSYF